MRYLCSGLTATLLLCGGGAHAAIIGDTLGDTTPQPVYQGYHGSHENLSAALSAYVDPNTNTAAPITRPNGGALVIGNVDAGEDPATSDQLLDQRFLVTGQAAQLQLTYLGLGIAGYRNVFGVYTYAADSNPATGELNLTPLFTQNVDAVGTTVQFSVPVDHYFGFYLAADGARTTKGQYFTENHRNTDNTPTLVTDHVLMYQTNRGLLLAWEDLAYNPSTGKLGDQDYEDLMVGLLSYTDGTPLVPEDHLTPPTHAPEPGSLAILGVSLIMLARRPRRTPPSSS